ncbi:MAG: phosphate ABC transporter permease PstA [Rhizobiaceae bacterium]
MTEFAVPHSQAARAARPDLIAKRYRTERRFRAYGLAALAVTAAFLIFLVADIVIKAIPAFTESTLTLPVELSAGAFDPAKPAAGDYNGLAKEALKRAIPSMAGRTDRKALLGLLSSGAGDDLRNAVVANPSMIGQKVETAFLLGADADLYLKGLQTGTQITPGDRPLTIAKSGESYGVAGIDAAPGTIIRVFDGALRVKEAANGILAAETIIPLNGEGVIAEGQWSKVVFEKAEADRRISDKQALVLETLKDKGLVKSQIAWRFLTTGDSREPELAGIRGALTGSMLTILVTLLISLPIGIAGAVYLEEFARKGRFTDLIEVNINNLAAVPSIIFGLLGLAVFLGYFGMPRSAPLVGGLVLALLVLPTIIIATRAALRSVPPSIKEAALGVGASHQQAVFHHVLPLAVPGILTGTILAVARAFGETAPLLMIGMVAFIVDIPKGLTDAATLLPVQIFLWSDLPEAGFKARTSAAIILLMCVLFLLNGLAIYLRKRFERRW